MRGRSLALMIEYCFPPQRLTRYVRFSCWCCCKMLVCRWVKIDKNVLLKYLGKSISNRSCSPGHSLRFGGQFFAMAVGHISGTTWPISNISIYTLEKKLVCKLGKFPTEISVKLQTSFFSAYHSKDDLWGGKSWYPRTPYKSFVQNRQNMCIEINNVNLW